GYFNLCRLASASHAGGKTYAHVTPEALLAAPLDDLVAIQPMRGLVRRGPAAQARLHERLAALKELMPGRLHLAVSRHLHPIAESLTFSFAELRYQYPKEMIPEGYTPQSWLEELVWTNVTSRFGKSIPDQMRELLQYELRLIAQLQFADYFLTVWDIVRFARS